MSEKVSQFWTVPQAFAWILSRDLAYTENRHSVGLAQVRSWHHQQRSFRLRSEALDQSYRAVEASISSGNLGFRTEEETSGERINRAAEAGAASATAMRTKAEWDRAERELIEALRTARITAIGKPSREALHESIPQLAWIELVFGEGGYPGCHVAAIKCGPGLGFCPDAAWLTLTAMQLFNGTAPASVAGWTDLRVPASEVIAAFPEVPANVDLKGVSDIWAALDETHPGEQQSFPTISDSVASRPAANDGPGRPSREAEIKAAIKELAAAGRLETKPRSRLYPIIREMCGGGIIGLGDETLRKAITEYREAQKPSQKL